MLPEPLQMRLKDLLALQTGLNFHGSGWHDFGLRFSAAAKDAGAADDLKYAHQLLSSPPSRVQIKTLAQHLTVGETYFFRDKRSFDALATHVLPELLRNRELTQPRLRIWSAGCCTGEEAYSIAILLDRLLPHQDNWDISIVATDINPRFLQKAERATYDEWSFRGTPDWVKQAYFDKRRNNTYKLIPKIRERVQFSYLNLAEDTYPSPQFNTDQLDVIFCRNVLMYFSTDQAQRVVSRLRAAIHENGLLLVNPAETSSTLFSDFSLAPYSGASFYQPRKVSPAATRQHANQQTAPAKRSRTTRTAAAKVLSSQPATTPATCGDGFASRKEAAKTSVILTKAGNSESGSSFARLARAAADEGHLDSAAQWCEQAIAAEKLNPVFHYLLATIEQERNRIQEAVKSLQRTLYLDHQFVLAHFALANLRLVEGRRREAARCLATVRKLLSSYAADEALPESDGLTASRLDNIAAALATSLKEDPQTAGYV